MNTRCPARSLILICILPFHGQVFGDETAPGTEAAVTTPPAIATEKVRAAIDGLSSPRFADRQKSLETLQEISGEQVELLIDAVENHSDSEVAKRCVELLERKFAVGDRDSSIVRNASEGLETAAKSERWFIAEAAQDSLNRHWKRRVEISLLELQKIGVPMQPEDPADMWTTGNVNVWPNRRGPTDKSFLKIFVDEYWKAGPRGYELLGRLSSLVRHDFMAGQSRMMLVLIDGHPLQQEEIAKLEAIFGDTRVQKRGRVMLGIQHSKDNNGFNEPDEGVNVSDVAEGSSAEAAGIRIHDSILKFEGSRLRDFEELVELLKAFRPDQEVTVQVRRPGERAPIEIKVKLKGWYER